MNTVTVDNRLQSIWLSILVLFVCGFSTAPLIHGKHHFAGAEGHGHHAHHAQHHNGHSQSQSTSDEEQHHVKSCPFCRLPDSLQWAIETTEFLRSATKQRSLTHWRYEFISFIPISFWPQSRAPPIA